VTPEERAELDELRRQWGGSYYITCTGGMWTAKPFRDRYAVLAADSADGLRAAIRRDYAAWRPESSSGP